MSNQYTWHIVDLTKEQVITWTQESLAVNAITDLYTSIYTQIENQINPSLVTPTLPWA